MAVYGYRLHLVQAYQGHTRKSSLRFGEGALADGVGFAESALRAIEGVPYVWDAAYAPRARDETPIEDLPPRTPLMRVDGVTRRGNSLEVTVGYGRVGDHAFLMSPVGAPDTPIKGSAASRHYTNVLFFPSAGDKAVMVSGVTGRTFTGEVLLKRLSVEAFRAAERSSDGDDWVRWVPRILVDQQRVAEVTEGANLQGVRLVRKSVDAAGVRRSQNLTLTQNGVPQSRQSAVRTIVGRWVEALAGNGSLTKRDEVAALVGLIDGSVSGLEFTDGTISYEEQGKTQTIGPSNLERILVYPVGDQPPTVAALRAAATDRLRVLLPLVEVPIDLG